MVAIKDLLSGKNWMLPEPLAHDKVIEANYSKETAFVRILGAKTPITQIISQCPGGAGVKSPKRARAKKVAEDGRFFAICCPSFLSSPPVCAA